MLCGYPISKQNILTPFTGRRALIVRLGRILVDGSRGNLVRAAVVQYRMCCVSNGFRNERQLKKLARKKTFLAREGEL